MEIEFNDVGITDEKISFKISDNKIYSFIGNSKSIKHLIASLIYNNSANINGNITKSPKIKIGYVKSPLYDNFNEKRVIDNFKRILNNTKYNVDKRIEESLKIVDINKDMLKIKYDDLNYIELKKISLALALLNNPNVLILEDYTEGLNNNDKAELSRLLRMLKNKYNKMIILVSKDTDYCYTISDYIYLLDDKHIVKSGNKLILKDINLLKNLNLKIPDIIKFITEYKKHNSEFNDYNNILDLIKAIYRDIGYKR